MENVTLEQIIRQYVSLPTHPNAKGWYPVLCKVCNDHGHKGMRAGFNFNGDVVGYKCFNCGHNTVYNPTEYANMPRKMVQVLDDFGVPEQEWRKVVFANLGQQKGEQQVESEYKSIEPKVLPIPDHFYQLNQAAEDDLWAQISNEYLTHERGIDPNDYTFYLSTGNSTLDPRAQRWHGRLIIPTFKNGNLIYYQGRNFKNQGQKYLGPPVSRDKCIHNFDKLFEQTDAPLYIVEGAFDAMSIGGVAVFGNLMTDEQIQWLQRSKRQKVVIPDKSKDGYWLAEQALRLGWQVSTPDIGNHKDINSATVDYGLLYILKTISQNIQEGFSAQVNIKVYCN